MRGLSGGLIDSKLLSDARVCSKEKESRLQGGMAGDAFVMGWYGARPKEGRVMRIREGPSGHVRLHLKEDKYGSDTSKREQRAG